MGGISGVAEELRLLLERELKVLNEGVHGLMEVVDWDYIRARRRMRFLRRGLRRR
jgi:hypothetical protein